MSMDSFVAMRAQKAAQQQAAKAQGSSTGFKGARKGGITEHITGPHLIPNVGREAMLPGEVVCRRASQRQGPPKKADQVKEPKKDAQRSTGRHQNSASPSADSTHRRPRSFPGSRSCSRELSRSPRRDDRMASVSMPRQDMEGPPQGLEEPEAPKEDPETARRRQQRERQAFIEAEKRRTEEEKQKLKELEEAKQRAKELQESRKKKLGGAFSLGADDEEEVSERQRLAREMALASRKGASRPLLTESKGSGTASSSLGTALPEGAKAAATDIDGRLHDHKYAKVWKDWDSNKRADPGEVARQFMKIAAIKRRGVDAPRRTRSRSRS